MMSKKQKTKVFRGFSVLPIRKADGKADNV